MQIQPDFTSAEHLHIFIIIHGLQVLFFCLPK